MWVAPTSDGGYISCGFSSLQQGIPSIPESANAIPSITKLGTHGQVEWSREFPFGDASAYGFLSQVIEVDDGYIAIGRKRDNHPVDANGNPVGFQRDFSFLVKVDKEGNTLVEKFLSTRDIAITPSTFTVDFGAAIKEVPGGGFIICGTAANPDPAIYSPPNPNMGGAILLMKLDNNLDIVFTKGLGGPLGERGFDVVLVWSGGTKPDGQGIGTHVGYAVIGNTEVAQGELDAFIARTDLNGNTTCTDCWVKTMDSGNSQDFPLSPFSITSDWYVFDEPGHCTPSPQNRTATDFGRSIVQLEDGNFALTISANRNLIDSDFSVNPALWACEYTYNGILVRHHAYLSADIALVKLNKNTGALIFNHHIGSMSGNDFIPQLVQTYDNGLAIVGTTANNNLKKGLKQDLFLIKADQNGTIEWREVINFKGNPNAPPLYKGSGGMCGFSLCMTKNGGFLMCGNNEVDTDNYQFTEMYGDCQPNFSFDIDVPMIIQSGNPVTLNTPQTVGAEIRVKAGGILNIQNTTLQFGDVRQLNDYDALADNNTVTLTLPRIVVEEGGELNINNATLTGLTACGVDHLWEGIQVWGDRNGDGSGQGKVIINNSQIEHSLVGILANEAKYNYLGHIITDGFQRGGGIIIANSTTFKNCRRSIHFSSYPFSRANAGQTQSKITGCSFVCDAPMPDANYVVDDPGDPLDGEALGSYSFVSAWDYHGVIFRANTFRNNGTFALPLSGIGITTDDASVRLERGCEQLDPCECVGQANSFHNLQYGFLGTGSNRTNTVLIDACEFENCNRGVFLIGLDGARITRNAFDIGQGMDNSYGVYLHECSQYQIEENNFSSQYPQNGGIWINNTSIANNSFANRLYNNDFEELKFSSVAFRENRGSNRSLGLKIKCNSYTNGTFDIMVPSQPGISEQQGSGRDETTPAGNTFDGCGSIANGEILNLGFAFDYFHHSNATMIPGSGCFDPLKVDLNNTQQIFNNSSSCPTSFGCDPGGGTGILGFWNGWIQSSNSLIDDLNAQLQAGGLSQAEEDALQDELIEAEANYQIAVDGLVSAYIHEGDLTQALQVLETESGEDIQARRIELYARMGDIQAARDEILLLENHPDWANFCGLQTFLLDLEEGGLDIFALSASSELKAEVEAIAEDQSRLGHAQALAILHKVFGEPIEEHFYFPNEENRKGQEVVTQLETSERLLSSAPNPFSEKTVIRAKVPKGGGEIRVFDLHGREILWKSLPEGEAKVSLNSTDLPQGIFIASLYARDRMLATLKIVRY